MKQLILRIKELEEITGCNRLTLRRWWEAGYFPKPSKLGSSHLAWRTEAIEKWMDESFASVVEDINDIDALLEDKSE